MVTIKQQSEENGLNLSDLVKPRISGGLNHAIAYERGGWNGLRSFQHERLSKSADVDRGMEIRRDILGNIKKMESLGSLPGIDRSTFANTEEQLIRQWSEARNDAFDEYGSLPESFRPSLALNHDGKLEFTENYDSLLLLTDTPQVSMTHLLQLADKAGMMLFPYDLLKKNAKPDKELKAAIKNITQATPDCEHYVLAPLTQIALDKLATIDGRPEIYASTDLKSDWTQISNYLLPAYRLGMRNKAATELNSKLIEQLEGRVDDIEEEIGVLRDDLSDFKKSTKKDFEQINDSILEINNKIAEERASRLAHEASTNSAMSNLRSNLMAEIQRLDHRIDCLMDPMFLAIPTNDEGSLFHSQNTAYVGPVWGPDLPKIVIAALGLSDTHARETIQKNVDRWVGKVN